MLRGRGVSRENGELAPLLPGLATAMTRAYPSWAAFCDMFLSREVMRCCGAVTIDSARTKLRRAQSD